MNDFLCIGALDLGYLGQISSTCPNSPNILKQVSLDPHIVFTLEYMTWP